jgi:hypothetical protein
LSGIISNLSYDNLIHIQGSNQSTSRSPQLPRRNNSEHQSTVSITLNKDTQADALQLLTDPILDQDFKVLNLKISIQETFDELSTTKLKELQKKFKDQSFVIFIVADNNTRFHIYWKPKDSRKVLSLKPYKDYFTESDKDLCEYVADFLLNCLQNDQSGKSS